MEGPSILIRLRILMRLAYRPIEKGTEDKQRLQMTMARLGTTQML